MRDQSCDVELLRYAKRHQSIRALHTGEAILARVDFLVVEALDLLEIFKLFAWTVLVAVRDQRRRLLAQKTGDTLEFDRPCRVQIECVLRLDRELARHVLEDRFEFLLGAFGAGSDHSSDDVAPTLRRVPHGRNCFRRVAIGAQLDRHVSARRLWEDGLRGLRRR